MLAAACSAPGALLRPLRPPPTLSAVCWVTGLSNRCRHTPSVEEACLGLRLGGMQLGAIDEAPNSTSQVWNLGSLSEWGAMWVDQARAQLGFKSLANDQKEILRSILGWSCSQGLVVRHQELPEMPNGRQSHRA